MRGIAIPRHLSLGEHAVNNILVVKLGGGEGLDVQQACADLTTIARTRPLVVVHGVSGMMAQLSSARGIEEQMLTSPTGHSFRYTNPETRELYVEATQIMNQQVVSKLQSQGVNAIGITDNVAIQGERKRAIRAIVNGRTRIIRDDHSGSISGVNANYLLSLIDDGYIPVLPPVADSPDGYLNIDGDRAGASVAGALQAETYIILSNVRGLYRNFPDENSFISNVPISDLNNAMQSAQGRMKRKILGAQEALNGGVQRVIISDGRISNPVSQALQGQGTVFTC